MEEFLADAVLLELFDLLGSGPLSVFVLGQHLHLFVTVLDLSDFVVHDQAADLLGQWHCLVLLDSVLDHNLA